MSDLISRLAARAVGQGAGAQPWVRSRFEPLAVGDPVRGDGKDSDTYLPPTDVIDVERRSPGAARRRLVNHPPAVGAPQSMPSNRWDAGVNEPHAAAPSSAASRRSSPGDEGRPPAVPPAPAVAAGSTAADSRVDRSGEGQPGDAVTKVGVTVAARPSIPSSTGLATGVDDGRFGGPSSLDGDGTAEVAPTVQIHIGRLDVRANLQTAPQPVAAASPGGDDGGVSLQDYLDGKRSAR